MRFEDYDGMKVTTYEGFKRIKVLKVLQIFESFEGKCLILNVSIIDFALSMIIRLLIQQIHVFEYLFIY